MTWVLSLQASDQPLFYAALAFALGIIAGERMWRPPLWWVVAITIFLLAAVIFVRRDPRAAFACALAAIIAVAACEVQLLPLGAAPTPDLAAYLSDTPVEVTAHVVRASLLRPEPPPPFHAYAKKDLRRQTLDIETETIAGEPVQAGIRVTLHSIDPEREDVAGESTANVPATPLFSYGQRLRFRAKLRAPRNYGDPGSMDYSGYLAQHGIQLTAAVRADRVERLEGFAGTRLALLRSRLRQSVVSHMLGMASPEQRTGWRRYLQMNEEEAGLLAAMMVGEQSLLTHDTRGDFQRTGTFHILVVSGMNIGILAFVVFWLAKRLRAGELVATIITIALSLFYAYLTDLGSPILRAALMLSFYLAARLLFRDRYSLNTIGASALLLLMLFPESLFEASFQLTFLAVVVLSAIIQPLLQMTFSPYRGALHGLDVIGYDAALAPRLAQFRLDLRMIAFRLAHFVPFASREKRRKIAGAALTSAIGAVLALAELVTITTIMQLAMALPMVIYFHRMALLGVPANLVVVPLTSVLMPVGIVALVSSYFGAWIAKLPVLLTALTLHAMRGTVALLGGTRFSDFRLAMPPLWVESFAFAAIICAVLLTRKSGKLAAISITAVFLSAVALLLPPRSALRRGAAEITAIDVGQGDSIFVASPDGKLLLVDGGGPSGIARSDSFDTGEDIVSPYLWSRGIERLDVIALTHAHSDHLGGLYSVLANFRPRELWVGENPHVPAYDQLLSEAAQFGVKVRSFHAGDDVNLGDASISVLAPERDRALESRPQNDDSLVMELRFGKNSALLSGDIDSGIERHIAGKVGRLDVLKVAHHGSATSTSPELLDATHPAYAVISAGYRNSYGHPKPKVLARLQQDEVKTFRTDTMGAVTFYMDGQHVWPETAALGQQGH